jgi:hypothetical protein
MIDDFYSRIEAEYKVEGDSWSLFSNFGDLSKEDGVIIRYEFLALNNFEADLFKKEIEDTKTLLIDYIFNRTQNAENPHLLAKYNHFLLYITRDNSYAFKTIENYQKVLAYYLSIHNQDQGFNILHFANILELIISLSIKYKININGLKSQINMYLDDVSLSSKIKVFIFEKVNSEKYKLFKSSELSSYPQLCIDLATTENDANIKERLLKRAVFFAQKAFIKELGKLANEMLGDLEYRYIRPIDEKNIAISHMNENHYKSIINYYRLVGKKEKLTKAIKEFEENKKHHKYIKLRSKVYLRNTQQVYDMVNEHLEDFLKNTPEIVILKLCFDDGVLLFLPYNVIRESVKQQMNNTIYHQFFDSKLNDFNNNTISVSHEKLREHEFYQLSLQNHTLPFVTELLIRAIDRGKLNYSKLKKTLLKTAFGIDFDYVRGESTLKYTWFSLIDTGLLEFFKQLKKTINQKQSDWRFAIDFLTPKFEAILREIVENAGDEVTKVKENGDTSLKSLEELFTSSGILKIFNDDDLFLFKHTFTKLGYNIRNNVAHGLYKPCDYTLSKAILVFLCILRLNKIITYIVKNNGK